MWLKIQKERRLQYWCQVSVLPVPSPCTSDMHAPCILVHFFAVLHTTTRTCDSCVYLWALFYTLAQPQNLAPLSVTSLVVAIWFYASNHLQRQGSTNFVWRVMMNAFICKEETTTCISLMWSQKSVLVSQRIRTSQSISASPPVQIR